MKRIASILGVAAVLAAPAAHAQFTQNYITTTNFTTAGTQERGLAYGVVDGNERVYVTSRNTGVFAYIYDADTGAFQSTAGDGTGSLNTTGISGGTVALQDIEVSDDGLIYGCNLTTTNINGTDFKCYFWANEVAVPVPVVFTGIPSAAIRLGDKIHVSGSVLGNDLTLWAATPTAPVTLYRCASTAVAAFTCTTHDLSGAGTAGAVNPIAAPQPGSLTSVWFNGNGILPRLITLPAAGVDGAGTLVTNVPAAQLNGTGNNAFVPFMNAAGDSTYLAMFEYSTTTTPPYARGRIVNVTPIIASGTNTGVNSYGITASVSGVSASGLGDIDVRENALTRDIFVLGPNGGFGSFTTTKASLPVELTAFSATADGATARFAWTTASETNNATFALEQHTGSTWAERATVAGRGTTSERATYSADVEGLAPGRHTFRLRQTDLDGTSTIAGTVTVEIAPESGLAVVLLGDGQGGTRAVRIASRAAQPVTARLYDVTGREVALLVSGEAGATVEAALPGGLAAGVYVVRVTSGAASATRTLVVR